MKKKYKRMLITVIVFLAVLGGCLLRISLDDTIQMKVVYWFFQGIDQQCRLQIDYNGASYDIEPHFPMEDTYAGEWFEVTYEIPRERSKMLSFSMELVQKKNTAQICSIEFYDHGVQVVKYSPTDISVLFQAENADVTLDYAKVNIVNEQEMIVLKGTPQFLDEYTNILSGSAAAYLNGVILAVCCALICYGFLVVNENSKQEMRQGFGRQDVLYACALIAIVIFGAAMSFMSKHYAHCDEQLTRSAIDYYLGHWIPPRADSHWQAGTYSYQYGAYGGYSRLNESTLYYFLAGKIGWIFREIFHLQTYYRMFGLVLLCIMIYTSWRQRKNKWIALALCVTPQTWYLFSYATSDQWDWFCGFYILLITLDKDSILHKIIQKKGSIRQRCFYMILCALLFAQMFLGKSNYIVVLAIPFIDLLIYWIRDEKWSVRVLLHYCIILALTFTIFMCVTRIPRIGEKYSIDLTNEEVQTSLESNRISEVSEKPQLVSTAPADNGVTFWDMLWSHTYMPTPALLFTSAIGYYVWSSLWGGTLYSMIMMLLYASIGIGLLFSLIRERQWVIKLKIAFAGGMVIALFCVALLYCYYVTYQPQGRYILPVFLLLGYAAAYSEKFLHSGCYKWLVAACCIGSLWCFGYAGLFTMYQNGLLFI